MNLKINFVLNSSSVLALINFGYKEFDLLKKKNVYKPLKYYTGIKVEKNDWDSKKKLPLNKAKAIELEDLRIKIENVFKYLRLQDNEITPESLKLELDEKIKGLKANVVLKKVRIVDFIQNEILTSNAIKEGSKNAYRGLSNKLSDYEDKIGKVLYSNDLNEDVYKDFMEDMKERLNKLNAVWGVQKVFKATLREIARKYKITVFNPTQDLAKKDRIQPVEADAVYLNFAQIQRIIEYQPDTLKLKNTKLILLTLLFTGCRQSDVHKIFLQHLYERNGDCFYYAKFFTEKTDSEIVIPILKPLQEAFEENDGKPAYKISQQKFNDYAKELIRECELTDEMTITYTDSTGKKQFETKPLFQFITSHVGRRSFITNLINHVPITVLTKITGHTLKDRSIIFGYNKISLLENAVLFRKQVKRAGEEDPEHFPFELV